MLLCYQCPQEVEEVMLSPSPCLTLPSNCAHDQTITAIVFPQDENTAVLEPYAYLERTAGKDIRGRLIKAFNKWLKVPEVPLAIIANIVNMLHTASLLIDDIEDDSQLRRGKPVAHKVYGLAQTINAGNYAYFLAMGELPKLEEYAGSNGMAKLYDIVTSELISLHQGQGLDILWRDSLTCPSEAQYIAMVSQKTGGLLRIAIRLMIACGKHGTSDNLLKLVDLTGIFFQIRDDFINLENTEYQQNKGFAEDLTEGKFSFPLIHGIRADTSNSQLINILKRRPVAPELKLVAISYLRDHTKSMEYTKLFLDSLEAEIRSEIEALGGNTELERILDVLHVS